MSPPDLDGVRRLFRLGTVRPQVRRDLDDEMAFHVAATVEALVAGGMTEAEAREEARRRFGDPSRYRRSLERIARDRTRNRRRAEMWDVAKHDLAFAMRGMVRAPGFTLAVVLTLALGIGANTVMFGVVDRLLLSPPQHVVRPNEVRLVYLRREDRPGHTTTGRYLTYPDYADLRKVGAFLEVGAYGPSEIWTLGRGAEAERVRVVAATASLFSVLGVQPALGRFYRDDEDLPGGAPVAVLSHEFWQRRFAGDPKILGRALDLGDASFTVVGVAPAGFTGAELSPVDVWLPAEVTQALMNGIDAEWKTHRNWWWLLAVARLSPGATDSSARVEATAVHRRARADLISEGRYDAGAEIIPASVIAARGPEPAAEARVARWLAAVSFLVLLIACANVANLLLGRAARRRREIAVRVALGVSRLRLQGQLLTESIVLALLGAVAALAVAGWGGGLVHRTLLPNVAFRDGGLGARLVVFTAVTTVLTALLAGLFPALQASRADVAQALKASGAGASSRRPRSRSALLILQGALSVVLLVGAGLFVKSLYRARTLDLGFDADQVAVVQYDWNEALPATERERIWDRALEKVRRLPGVRAAATTFSVPFWSSLSLGNVAVPELDSVPQARTGGPYVNKVGSGYFTAMGLDIHRGRAFTPEDDREGAPPVAVLSESMARRIWPRADALGRCIIVSDDGDPPCTRVVGIVENHRREELVEDEPHFLYFLNRHHPAFQGPPQGLMVGTIGPAEDQVEAIRGELRGVSAQVRFVQVRTLQSLVAPQMRSWRLGADTFAGLGLLALVVAAVGLYSVLSFEVAQRRRELGVRAALGADARSLVGLVFRMALGIVGIGVLVGLTAAVAASRFVEPLLFRVSPTDGGVYAVVVGVLGAVAAAAGILPAWRATRADPVSALRSE